ncbi:PREDICTED: disabled homolog 2-interacting protein-like [Amphimedon queenslandica]|uniref:Ras-GAP domain-containing protein n=1 Tax=Amphimedon queenslandica TaxID=400682 RepID=A0A1X7TWN6_AMPQE|nr:PREDICTED: disabled homolog 2-interacting protein-like [Amphimedon queenslandica]|eukprot:XP_019857271.1 PREDICTED: disabled homolog 2-interacting protein-like [Amphimedon queenslandica]
MATNDKNTTEGWLLISHDMSSTAEWQKRYCIIAHDDRKLYFFLDQDTAIINKPPSSPRFNLRPSDGIDGAAMSSLRRGSTNAGGSYTLSPGDPSPFQRGARTTRSFRDRVKSLKAPKKVPQRQQAETHSSTSGDLILPRMRGGRSLDNLHRVSMAEGGGENQPSLGEPGTFVDLATKGTLSIQLVHPSVSPRHSCFRLITDSDIIYASCGSAEELDRWVTSLNKFHRPNRDHLRRLNTQVFIWIFEARHLQPKKKYYCEIYLNNLLYSQTCCKPMSDILFWGEPFNFEELPMVGSIQIRLIKETYKKKDCITELIGKIDIPTLVLENNSQITEKWFPVTLQQTPKAQSSQKENPSIRIKIHYQVVSILPLKHYNGLLKYITTNFASLCEVLEPVISAKVKDEIAQTLLKILEHSGKAKEFLCDIVMAEVQHVDNENLIFRGNTFATKAVDTYMKMVGEAYLRETLKPFINDLLESEDDCEVDPTRLPPTASLTNNQQNLTRHVEKVWFDILSSWTRFPSDLRDTLYGIRQRFGSEKEEACFKLISGSIFLRFFCPAILSPSLFQLCQEYPDEKVSRKLTLVAKVIQNLANFARFGVKEEYMCFMNDFVGREIQNMKQFIDRISSPVPDSYPVVEWGPFHIDLGRELSIVSNLLLTLIPSLKEEALAQVSELPGILDGIKQTMEASTEDPFTATFEALRVMQSTISKFTPQSLASQSLGSAEFMTNSATTSPVTERRPRSHALLSVSPAHSRQTSAPIEFTGSVNSLPSPSHSLHLSKPSYGHRPSSSMPQQQLSQLHESRQSSESRTSVTSSNSPSPTNGKTQLSPSHGPTTVPRRNSDSAVRIHAVKSSKSIESNLSMKFDQTLHMADLTAENSDLIQERDKMKLEILELRDRLQDVEKDNEGLRNDLALSETLRKKAETEVKSLKENRGKVLRGLSTQTEIATAQFRLDFENLKKQLESKEEVIALQEKKIKSLIESNCTLRNGLEQVQGAPSMGHIESEDDEGVQSSLVLNGHSRRVNPVQAELAKFIKQLDI